MTKKAIMDIVAGVWFETLFALLLIGWASSICLLIYLIYR